MFFDSRDSFVMCDGRMAAAIGVNDLIIVDTPDALLVADREQAQDVKKIVERLKAPGSDKHALHLTVARPWGTYTVLQDAARFKIKRVEVKPGASLSLQMHHHRNEHWVVVSGTALVVNGDATMTLQTNESTYIPAGHKHRLENPGPGEPRDHRGPGGRLSRRGRHRALRGPIRSVRRRAGEGCAT